MGRLKEIITPLHTSTSRDYLARMVDDKIACMEVAREFEREYWDGDRRYGYGGYRYDGRWKPVAEELIQIYELRSDARILDIGCGKGHLIYELSKLLPDSEISGCDISAHALANVPPAVKHCFRHHRAELPYPFDDRTFDLVVSIGALHNLTLPDLETALSEIERVGTSRYVLMESYRNTAELFNLQCWALTCESFFSPVEWTWLFKKFGYTGDYEFIYFE